MKRFVLLVAAALALPMCNPLPPPPGPPTPPDGSDAAPPAPPAPDAAPGPSDACGRSYEHLIRIHCKPQQPSVGTWIDVCRNGRQHGAFRLDGIDRATTPEEAHRAGVDCTAP